MRIYEPKQADLFFISPYTNVNVLPNQLIIHQTIFAQTTSLSCEPKWAESLLAALTLGTTEQTLVDKLCEVMSLKQAQELLQMWLQMGCWNDAYVHCSRIYNGQANCS